MNTMTPLPYDHVSEALEETQGPRARDRQYVYIVQASPEAGRCKIGITNNLERRLDQYNSMTGKSADNRYTYLYTCETADMAALERAITEEFGHLREQEKKEIYFYNPTLFKSYVEFIEAHELFAGRVSIKKQTKAGVRIVQRPTPSLGERGLTFKGIMQRAKRVENDEFYTRYEDVGKEIAMYDAGIWKGKTVFCNCDDAVGKEETNTSAFALYFIQKFRDLKLKKLICTHHSGAVDLFNQGAKGYVFTKTGFREMGEWEYPKGYTGSFDDPLSVEILNNEADIVCTNPPFSRCRDYWDLVVGSGKKFLIISNVAITLTRAYIHFFKDGQAWPGHNEVDEFLNPKREPVRASGHWFTNFEIAERPKHSRIKILPLKQIPEKYQKRDDTGMLLLDHGYLPSDYKKPFGLSTRPILNGALELGFEIADAIEYYPYIGGKKQYGRVLVRRKA